MFGRAGLLMSALWRTLQCSYQRKGSTVSALLCLRKRLMVLERPGPAVLGLMEPTVSAVVLIHCIYRLRVVLSVLGLL